MKIRYFSDTDTLYIEFKAGQVTDSRDLDENTLVEVDAQGQLLLALTLVGPAASLQADADGEAAQALRAACQRISAALGWQGP